MNSKTTLTLVDGVKVIVPDSLELITPYVLREQEDWFEDEIKFLRRLLLPGEKAIDIGANYGVYTLSIAQTVGVTGNVWAFEPTTTTANLLAEGIAANGFTQVFLEKSALSSVKGTAELALKQHSEMNTLIRGKPSPGASETVPVVTLDDRMETYGWRDIDFVKIDAEGEETNILLGGKRFFATLSPLVQYEIKAGDDLHMELVQAFKAIGYDSYRLIPGLDVLVPFKADLPPDGFLLNLFCCKPDCAARLAARNTLVNAGADFPDTRDGRRKGARDDLTRRDSYDWRNTLGRLPYGRQLSHLWEQTLAIGRSDEVVSALALYAGSRDSSLPAAERFGALEASFLRLRALCEEQPTQSRLASLARVARDYGARSVAVGALARLSDTIFRQRQIDVREPFLVPGERFDAITPGEGIGNWVLSAVLEEFERNAAFSSFYTGMAAKGRLETIRDLGLGGPEMQRRLSLLCARFGLPSPETVN